MNDRRQTRGRRGSCSCGTTTREVTLYLLELRRSSSASRQGCASVCATVAGSAGRRWADIDSFSLYRPARSQFLSSIALTTPLARPHSHAITVPSLGAGRLARRLWYSRVVRAFPSTQLCSFVPASTTGAGALSDRGGARRGPGSGRAGAGRLCRPRRSVPRRPTHAVVSRRAGQSRRLFRRRRSLR